MNCIKAHSVYTNQSTKSISFNSHVCSSRISIKNPSGLRNYSSSTQIGALNNDDTSGSPYQVLEIDEKSVVSISDIKKAYKKMAKKYHPDVSPPDQVEENMMRFIMVKQAYETLTDPHKSHDAQVTEEKKQWKIKWRSQLDELNRRSNNI